MLRSALLMAAFSMPTMTLAALSEGPSSWTAAIAESNALREIVKSDKPNDAVASFKMAQATDGPVLKQAWDSDEETPPIAPELRDRAADAQEER